MIKSNVKFNYNSSDPLNGVFTYLQKKFNKQNIHEIILNIKASSTEQNLYNPVIMRDFATNSYWRSEDKNESWYEVDFLQNMFKLKSYVIRNHAGDFFQQWQVLGSNDGVNFDIVDNEKDFPQQSNEMHNILFNCTYPKTRRIFRIVSNGKRYGNIYGNDFKFVIHRLEFYGTLVPNQFIKTCKINQNNSRFTFIILIAWYIKI